LLKRRRRAACLSRGTRAPSDFRLRTPSHKNAPVSTTMNSFYAGVEKFDVFVNNFALTIHGLFALTSV
jgi:hypothetical protein